MEVIAVAGEDRAVRQVTERAENRVGRGVVNHIEHCACGQRAGASIDKSKRHVAVNGHAEGGSLRRFDSTPVQHALVGREGVEGQRVIDGQSAGAGGTVPGQQDCSGAGSCSDCHRAVDFARAAKHAGVNLHCTAARAGTCPIFHQKAAGVNGGGCGVGIRIGQTQFAVPHFCKRTARAAADSAILDQPGKGRAKVVRADGQVIRPEKDQTISFDRAGRHARSALLTYIKVAVAENLHARRAARRSGRKYNQTARTSAQTAVGDQRGVARVAGVE